MRYDIKYIDTTDENEQMDGVAMKIAEDGKSYWIDIFPGFSRDYLLESLKNVFPEGTEHISANDFIATLILSVSKGNVFAFNDFPNSLKEKDVLIFTDVEKYEDGSSVTDFFYDVLKYRLNFSKKKTILVGHYAQVSGDIRKLIRNIPKIVINDKQMESKNDSDGDMVYRITIEVSKLLRKDSKT